MSHIDMQDLARFLLGRSIPKGKLWKRHLKLRMKLLFTQTNIKKG
jgi:hypothetical protein